MPGCACQSTWRRMRFGANLVGACPTCHALRVEPLVDARVPSLQEHADCLLDEIRVAQQEADAREVQVRIDRIELRPGRVFLEGQAVGGDPRRLGRGARVEVWPEGGKDEETANAEVVRRSASHVSLDVDRPEWSDLRPGVVLHLRAPSDATIYRNLLKAFLAIGRNHDLTRLMEPSHLPPLPGRLPAVQDEGLRPGQAHALAAAAGLPDDGLLLLHGPPGTGKTTVIARLLSDAVRRGRSVLVTSHTHVAIDNALRKAMRADAALATCTVRLGESRNVAPDLAHLNRRVSQYHMDPEEPDARPLFANLQARHRIVGMTLDALASSYLWAHGSDQDIEPFDYVIVDEAGMNGFPKTALAHAVARRLVLVGDPLQLPPIVRSWRFGKDENHRRSSFETLQRQRPDLSILLDEQFRCHPDIYSWSKDAVYGGKVSSRRPPNAVPWTLDGVPLESPVVWLNTGGLAGNRAEPAGTSRVNALHQDIAVHVVRDLRAQGVGDHELGYISPFRAQAEAVRERLEGAGITVTASTVDAFQGNERRIILYDLTTTTPAKPHEDHRRLNVSITRAEDLLLILGPRAFVQDDAQNPFHASLQRWKAVRTLSAPVPKAPPMHA